MSSPDARRYSVTTFDPGARLVLTHGCRVRPRSNAFFATRPAPIITLGFEVFVQVAIIELRPAWNPLFACFNETRSCGRRGPARHGSTVDRSSSTVSVYTGSG